MLATLLQVLPRAERTVSISHMHVPPPLHTDHVKRLEKQMVSRYTEVLAYITSLERPLEEL